MEEQNTAQPSLHHITPQRVTVIRNAMSYDFGGAERLAAHIAQENNVNGIETVLISRHAQLLSYAKSLDVKTWRGWWWSKQNWSGASLILFPAYLLWQGALILWYLQAFIHLKPSAVHILSKDDFIAATIAGKLLRAKVVWTDTADLKYIYSNHRVWYKNPVGKLVYLSSKLTDSIMLVSKSEKQLIEESLGFGLPKKYIIVRIAGRNEIVEPIVRQKADQAAVVFCSTSRLVATKGISELIQAFNRLSEGSDHYRLWLVGDGPEKKMFQALASSNPNNIVFIGHSDKPLQYVAAGDIFIHPSYHEGFSLSIAEAAMLGKPMIATNVGGNPEIVDEHNGILVPAKDIDGLYEAMRQLGTNNSLRKKLGQNARNDYVSKFDFSTIMKTTVIPLYEKN